MFEHEQEIPPLERMEIGPLLEVTAPPRFYIEMCCKAKILDLKAFILKVEAEMTHHSEGGDDYRMLVGRIEKAQQEIVALEKQVKDLQP